MGGPQALVDLDARFFLHLFLNDGTALVEVFIEAQGSGFPTAYILPGKGYRSGGLFQGIVHGIGGIRQPHGRIGERIIDGFQIGVGRHLL